MHSKSDKIDVITYDNVNEVIKYIESLLCSIKLG